MSEDRKSQLSLAESRELVPAPRPTLPPLPTSSGAWGPRLRVLRKDTEYIEQHGRFLSARAGQIDAMRALIESRVQAEIALTDLTALPEICAAHYLLGRRKRASDVLLHDLKCQAQEATARAALATAQKNLAAFDPPPASEPSQASGGLSPSEVDELLATLPEIPETSRKTLFQLLKGRLQEKFS